MLEKGRTEKRVKQKWVSIAEKEVWHSYLTSSTTNQNVTLPNNAGKVLHLCAVARVATISNLGVGYYTPHLFYNR